MSRHLLTKDKIQPLAIPVWQKYSEVYVGWDQPMLTFYLQAYLPEKEQPVIWEGNTPERFYELENFTLFLGSRALWITPEFKAVLYEDRDLGRMV